MRTLYCHLPKDYHLAHFVLRCERLGGACEVMLSLHVINDLAIHHLCSQVQYRYSDFFNFIRHQLNNDLLWSPYGIYMADHYIFMLWFVLSSFFLSFFFFYFLA